MIEELKQMLIRQEDEVLHAYPDSEGWITIGVGHLIDERKGGKISHAASMFILDEDINNVIGQCDRAFDWFDDLDEARKIVVLSMVFNLGLYGFKKFKKTIAFIEQGLYISASEEMKDSKWYRQVGKRGDELSKIMLTGELE